MRVSSVSGFAGLLLLAGSTIAQDDAPSPEDVRNRTRPIVDSILGLYNSSDNLIPGIFQGYYWWMSGLAFDSLVRYWALTDDDSITDTLREGLYFQVGPDYNYMPPNQSKSLGNDDQSSWGLAAMTAAESGLPLPDNANATWFELADTVFNSQVLRWNEEQCGGGIKWQIFTFNNGYNYKNSQTMGQFTYLAARLYKYTGNETYNDWALRAYQWTVDVGFINETTSAVYDGADDILNCSEVNHIQWTINVGQFLSAATYACSVSCTDTWRQLLDSMVSSNTKYFAAARDNFVIDEVACAPSGTCNKDQLAFRAPLARALGNVVNLLPNFNDTTSNNTHVVRDVIVNSAAAAVRSCTSDDGTSRCGYDWRSNETDTDLSQTGLGQDLAALEILMAAVPGKPLLTAENSTNDTTAANSTAGGNATATGDAPAETTSGSGAAGLMASSSMASVMTVVVMGALCVFI